jgi:aromatic ring hydroxylase
MIRTGEEYRARREVWIDGECVQDVTIHIAFKSVVDRKARMYDVARQVRSADIMSYRDAEERYPSCSGRRPKRRIGMRNGVRSTPAEQPL